MNRYSEEAFKARLCGPFDVCPLCNPIPENNESTDPGINGNGGFQDLLNSMNELPTPLFDVDVIPDEVIDQAMIQPYQARNEFVFFMEEYEPGSLTRWVDRARADMLWADWEFQACRGW